MLACLVVMAEAVLQSLFVVVLCSAAVDELVHLFSNQRMQEMKGHELKIKNYELNNGHHWCAASRKR